MIIAERTAGSTDRPARPPWLGWVFPIVLAAVPWAWFAIRDLGPALDAVAIGLPLGAAVAAMAAFGVAMLSERMRFALVSLSLLVFAIVAVVEPRLPQRSPAPARPFLLVSANTFEGNPTPGPAVRALLAQDAEVVVAVEATTPISIGVAHAYPYDLRGGGLRVLSVWPVHELPPIAGVSPTAVTRVEVLRPGEGFVVYAVHLPNPLHEISFADQEAMAGRLLANAEREDLPVVLAGDFNMSDRSSAYRAFDAALRDAMRASFAGTTYDQDLWGLLQLRIDHVFVSRDLCASRPGTFGVPGSDHDGIRVDLGPCR